MSFQSAAQAAPVATGPYFPYPYSLDPLPLSLEVGLIPVGLFGLLSVTTTSALLTYLAYHFVTWKKHHKTYVSYNQYVILIFNLLIADLQQSMSFLISFHWIKEHRIVAPTSACFAQGWLLHMGDISSGFFVLAIALHTFYTAAKGRRLPHKTFVALIAGIWSFALLLTAIGPLQYRDRYFVRAGAWCWVSSEYERERLVLHYIWIFIVEFSTVLIYTALLIYLKRKMHTILPASQSVIYAKVDRAAKLMLLYPLVYVLLTLPLAAGRMWSMTHDSRSLPDAYACAAGALITSCGWVDSLLYTLTRRSLLQNSLQGSGPRKASQSSGWSMRERGSAHNRGITHTRTVTITGGVDSPDHDHVPATTLGCGRKPAANKRQKDRLSTTSPEGPSPTGSTDPIVPGHGLGIGIGHVRAKTTMVVSLGRAGSQISDERAIPPGDGPVHAPSGPPRLVRYPHWF
ncbi:hypothetical protein LTR28_003444 [Elasticomyces elasticus]|nr:hypothetical protein LTR28_003444 [Elasticomyces elasticus]